MNVHPRSAGLKVLDSQPISSKHLSLGPFLYCFSNKKHKLVLEGEEHQMHFMKHSISVCNDHYLHITREKLVNVDNT